MYWNDDFLFSVDTTSNMVQNREALWNAAKEAYQSGTFGDPSDIDTQILYWATMEKYHYPNAGNICNILKGKKEKQEQQTRMGGITNEMPGMQNGNGNM